MSLVDGICLQCGKAYRKRNRKFCSNSCKMTWANLHNNAAKTAEVRAKLSALAKATNRQAQLMTPESRAKAAEGISRASKGKRLSEEHKRKIGEGSKRAGCKPPSNPHLVGSSHPRWQGGHSSIRSVDRTNPLYIAFRGAVLLRDAWTCQDCGKRGGKLEVHHVKAWGPHPELRYEPSNGITLCRPCHKARHRGVPRPVTVGPRTRAALRSSRGEA